MKPIFLLIIIAIVTLRAGAEPIDDYLFPPDLLLRAKDEIRLTDEQRDRLQDEAAKMDVHFRELQERLQKENDALAAIVKPVSVDEDGALAQLDKVLEAEREVKRAQLAFMLAIKKQLTPEQQAKLTEFRKAHGIDRASMEELHKRLVEKAQRVKDGVDKLHGRGGDPAPIAAIMEEAEALMHRGKTKEAEAAIDRALKELGGEK
ncbi:MAG: hypothetical protein ABI318_17095 [Chthoniobacteraceae bacterium]